MNAPGTIRYLKNEEIDREAWDSCIKNASNGLIYGYSYYLDHMAGNWDGLVLGQYKWVMPLPWRKKAGIFYLYQPFLTAQLGLFGNNIDAELLLLFLQSIPQKFRLWEFSLNHANLFNIQGYSLFERINYVLSLNQPYASLYAGYRDNIKRNIKKSQQYSCRVKTGIAVEEIIDLVRQQDNSLEETALKNFKDLYYQLKDASMAKTYGIVSGNDQLLASAVFLFSNNRAYYILVGNHPNGRTLGASHALIDSFIKDHAEQDMLLDFEGSDIRNLAFFYSSFGATEERYPGLRVNRLPFYLKWLKKD